MVKRWLSPTKSGDSLFIIAAYGSAGTYFNAVMVRLPASGMIFMLEADLLINTDGTYDEITGTAPDIAMPSCELPASVTRNELLKDAWIKKIINDL